MTSGSSTRQILLRPDHEYYCIHVWSPYRIFSDQNCIRLWLN